MAEQSNTLRSLWRRLRGLSDSPDGTRETVQRFWRNPSGSGNSPENYLEGHERSELLVELVRRHAPEAASILEIGCNVGRNLDHLYRAGYTALSAIEISEAAIEALRRHYPETSAKADIHIGPVEQEIVKLGKGQFDVVFTMAVLEHIHRDSDFVLDELVRVTRRTLITIEDESSTSWRHFPRKYRELFEARGMRSVEERPCEGIPFMGPHYIARVFAAP